MAVIRIGDLHCILSGGRINDCIHNFIRTTKKKGEIMVNNNAMFVKNKYTCTQMVFQIFLPTKICFYKTNSFLIHLTF